MADYTQITLFTPKDSLSSGNPAKLIKGADFDPEFDAIATAILSKYDSTDIASNAEAAALTGDSKLITPGKLAHALQNGSITLGASVLLNGGIAASDVARLSVDNTFTGGTQALSNATPVLRIHETDAGTDDKNWLIRTNAGAWNLSPATDAAPTTPVGSAISIGRSGTTIGAFLMTGTSLTFNSNTVWHAGNDGVGSGLNADLLDGVNLGPSGSYTGSTVPRLDASGHMYANYYNSDATNGEDPSIGQFMVTNGIDNFLRKASVAHVQSQLGIATANAGTYTPAPVAVANCSISSALGHRWSRVDNVVTVSGAVAISVTSGGSTLTEFDVPMPVSTSFTTTAQGHGSGSNNTSNGAPAFLHSVASTNRMKVSFFATASGSQTVYYILSYQIV